MVNPLAAKFVTLANGDTVPLYDAAVALALIRSHLDLQDTEWDAVFYLRQLCLGNEIEPEQSQILVRERLLQENGEVSPVMKAIVLSSIRGEGRVLYIDSPFTTSLDRAFVDFIHSRSHLEANLPTQEYRRLYDHDFTGMIKEAIAAVCPPPLSRQDAEKLARKYWTIKKDSKEPNGDTQPGLNR